MTAIAIDGPAGAGKSTVARAVADRLGFTYVDTGAMYRAVALAALEAKIGAEDGAALASLAKGLELRLDGDRVLLAGTDVSDAIRSEGVTAASALIARHPGVRAAMVRIQQETAASGDVVMEGRDIGSKVLPDAEVKVFLTASLDERARRRGAQTGADDHASLRESLATRDESDRSRDASPLVTAPGAVEIDTTDRSIDEVVDAIVRLAREAV